MPFQKMKKSQGKLKTITVQCPRCKSTYATDIRYAKRYRCLSCWSLCRPKR